MKDFSSFFFQIIQPIPMLQGTESQNLRLKRVLIWILAGSFIFSVYFLTFHSSSLYVLDIQSYKDGQNDFIHHERKASYIEPSLIDLLIEKKRIENEEAMLHYKYHPELQKVKSLNDLLIAEGGNPIRNMVITTWRSGSTFLGDLLQSHPASFYHYETLLPYGIMQMRRGPMGDMALRDLRKVMHCNYTNMEHYTAYAKDNVNLLSHNAGLWNLCATDYRDICFKPKYLAGICSIYPFQSIKTVRLRTPLVEQLLKDKSLGLRVLLLIRDPRGTIQSRHHRTWCPGEPDCDDPRRLCRDLIEDYSAALAISKDYPKEFRVIRYEDMSLDIQNKSKELFNFFRLTYHQSVKDFLETHTKESKGGVSSTFRDSKTAPFHWKLDLPWTEIQLIQKDCSEAIELWGYKLAYNASHAKNFNPIGVLNWPHT